MCACIKCSHYVKKKCVLTQLNLQGGYKICAGYIKYLCVTEYNLQGSLRILRIFFALGQAYRITY